MAYDMVFSGAPDQEGEVERFFLCSTGSWQAFKKWAESLGDLAPALADLVQDGEFEGTNALSLELSDLEPDDAGVRATLDALKDKLGVGDPEESLTITDDDGEPDESTLSDTEKASVAAALESVQSTEEAREILRGMLE